MSEEVKELTIDDLAEAMFSLAQETDRQTSELQQKINDSIKEIHESVQQKTEANERLISELLMGYQELTTVVQVTLHKLWGDDIEATADFKKKLEVERRRMIDWIKNGAAAMATSEQDLNDALEQLFPSKPSDSE